MVLRCCNPNCSANFFNLYEGEWILIDSPDRTAQRYWLCGYCAPRLYVLYDQTEGMKVVSKYPIKKSSSRETPQDGESPGKVA